jgi:hypothetical protein
MLTASRRAALPTLILLIGICGTPLFADQTAAAPGGSPLLMTVSCQNTADGATLRVMFQNQSNRDTAIVLGRKVGSDQTQVVDTLRVMTIRALTGANEDFAFINPKHAVLTGRAEPWIVAIRAGATYELDAPVQFFISGLTYSLLEPSAVPGTRLIFEGRPVTSSGNGKPGGGQAPVWTGQLEAPIESCG